MSALAIDPLQMLSVVPQAHPMRDAKISQKPRSFDALFHAHAADVHRLVWRLLGPGARPCDVEDLCQQTFMALHKAWDSFRGDSKVSTWVYGIASRTVYKELRRRRRHRAMVEALEAKTAALMQSGVEGPEQETHVQLAEVWTVLMKIHPKKRVVFVLHEVEGLTGAEIAEVLKIKVATVHSRLFYARRELLEAMEDNE